MSMHERAKLGFRRVEALAELPHYFTQTQRKTWKKRASRRRRRLEANLVAAALMEGFDDADNTCDPKCIPSQADSSPLEKARQERESRTGLSRRKPDGAGNSRPRPCHLGLHSFVRARAGSRVLGLVSPAPESGRDSGAVPARPAAVAATV